MARQLSDSSWLLRVEIKHPVAITFSPQCSWSFSPSLRLAFLYNGCERASCVLTTDASDSYVIFYLACFLCRCLQPVITFFTVALMMDLPSLIFLRHMVLGSVCLWKWTMLPYSYLAFSGISIRRHNASCCCYLPTVVLLIFSPSLRCSPFYGTWSEACLKVNYIVRRISFPASLWIDLIHSTIITFPQQSFWSFLLPSICLLNMAAFVCNEVQCPTVSDPSWHIPV